MGHFFILLSIIVIFVIDAARLKVHRADLYQKTIQWAPPVWGVFATVLFFLAGPLYLYRRGKYFELLREVDNATLPVFPIDRKFLLFAECTGVILAWYTFSIVIGIVYGLATFVMPFLEEQLMQFVVLSFFSNILFIYLIFRAVRRSGFGSFGERVHFKKGKAFFVRALFLPVCLGAILAGLNFLILSFRDATPETPLTQAVSSGTPLAILLFVGAAVITAPIFEEIIYRGYIYSVMRKFKGKLFTVLFIATLFCLFHVDQLWGDWLAIALIFFMGLSVTLFRSWTGSVIPGVIVHYAYNFLTFAIPVVILLMSNLPFYTVAFCGESLSVDSQVTLLKQSIDQQPDFAEAYNTLAWVYAENDQRLEEAMSLIDTALLSEPHNPAFLDTKAEVFYRLDMFDAAIEIEEKLVADYGDDPFFEEQLAKFKQARAREETTQKIQALIPLES